jgi:hypothetical protein
VSAFPVSMVGVSKNVPLKELYRRSNTEAAAGQTNSVAQSEGRAMGPPSRWSSKLKRKSATIATFCVALSLFASLSAADQEQPLSGPTLRSEPALDQIARASQGDPVYSEILEVLTDRIRLLDDAIIDDDFTIPLGTELEAGPSDSELSGYCQTDREKKVLGMKAPRVVCLEEEKNGAFTGQTRQTIGAIIVRRTRLKLPVKFERIKGVVSGPTPFRREILFSGAAAGVLRMVYREFANDLARPAFTQELTYDLPAGNAPLDISIKGARIQITEASNSGLTYRVLSPLTRPAS